MTELAFWACITTLAIGFVGGFTAASYFWNKYHNEERRKNIYQRR